MSGLTKLSLKELYDRKESLEQEMYAELSMDASGDCQDSIVDLFEPEIQKIEAEIDSRSETDLTKLSIEELYQELESLETGLEMNLLMDGSGELGGKIYDDFQPLFERVQKEIDSRSQEELDQYHWPEEEDDMPC